MRSTGSRYQVFTDEQWERIEPLLPSNQGRRGHPFGEHRRVVEVIAYRYRTGVPWRDLPREQFGPWQTVWKRHRRYAADGTWDRVLTHVLAEADAAGMIDWAVSVDATIAREIGRAQSELQSPQKISYAVFCLKNHRRPRPLHPLPPSSPPPPPHLPPHLF